MNALGTKAARGLAMLLAALTIATAGVLLTGQSASAGAWRTVCDQWWNTGSCCVRGVPSVKEQYRHCRRCYIAGSQFKCSDTWTEYRCDPWSFCFKF
jgi:hypothetical protein